MQICRLTPADHAAVLENGSVVPCDPMTHEKHNFFMLPGPVV